MSETLTRINFTEGMLPAEANLGVITPEQQDVINRIAESKNTTAYFTSTELVKLRTFISTGVVSDEFERFIAAQLSEGLASSDIVGEDPKYTEQLDQLDEYAKEILFGTHGIMPYMQSQTAQDHMAVSFATSLLRQISLDDSISNDVFNRIVRNEDPDFTLNLVTQLGLLQSATNTQLNAGGEQNSICMGISQGTTFFNTLLEGNFSTAEEVQTELESANTPDEIEIDFTGFDDTILPQIKTIVARRMDDSGDISTAIENAGTQSTDSPEELSGFQKMLQDLLKGFKDLLKMISGFFGSGNTEEISTDAIEVSDQDASTVGDFFTTNIKISIAGISGEQFHELFADPDNISEDAKSVIQHVTLINRNNSTKDKLQSIFIETLPSADDANIQIPKIERFMQEMNASSHFDISIKNPDSSINTVNLQLLVHHYQAFTMWQENQTPNDEVILYQGYFNQLS